LTAERRCQTWRVNRSISLAERFPKVFLMVLWVGSLVRERTEGGDREGEGPGEDLSSFETTNAKEFSLLDPAIEETFQH
jgi:hypothetical protein